MGECYFTFDRLPNYQMSTRTLMEVTNRLRGSNPRIRITEAELATVRAPTALLWGEHDPFGDAGTGKRIAALVQHGRFQELPGGGHLPWLDDPETAGRLVMDLLRSTEHQGRTRGKRHA
jgi:pimeloyl-ACP methyl ester carboxylesterase